MGLVLDTHFDQRPRLRCATNLMLHGIETTLIVRYYVIAPEEAYLQRRFGQSYLDYQARVPRWFGCST